LREDPRSLLCARAEPVLPPARVRAGFCSRVRPGQGAHRPAPSLGAQAKDPRPPLFKCRTTPLGLLLSVPQPPLPQNPSRRSQYSELGAADTVPSFRRSFDVLNLL
jgi:hypothetical protein